MNNNQNIKTKILAPVLSVSAILIAVMVATVTIISSNTTGRLIDDSVQNELVAFASQLETINEQSYVTIKMLREEVYSGMTKENPRDYMVNQLISALNSNTDAGAYWIAFAPNGVDGKDSLYPSTEVSDETGRFLPCVSRGTGGDVVIEALADVDISEYYTGAFDSKAPYITEPFAYSYSGVESTVYSICLPLFEGGASSGKVIGVIGADVKLDSASELMSSATIMEDGYLTLLTDKGMIVTNPDDSLILQNFSELPFLSKAEDLIESVSADGKQVRSKANSKVFYLVPIETGDVEAKWVLCGVVGSSEYNSSTIMLTTVIILFGIAILAIIAVVSIRLIARVLRPLDGLVTAAHDIAKGNINSVDFKVTGSDTKDEIAILTNAFAEVVGSVRMQSDMLSLVADGDYSKKVELRSDGDVMGISINRMIETMNKLFADIRNTTEDVNTGADQIAQASENLAQSSTVQAQAVQELSDTVARMSDETKRNSEKATEAADLALVLQELTDKGKSQMEEMNSAMNEITESSNNINKVIKTIDDIAFQTNILALNASVEAARAGAAGKGFAVVAEEVRNLASKSAEAAKNSTEMIELSISKVAEGDKIVSSTSESLNEISDGIHNVTSIFKDISQHSTDQANAINDISTTVSSISDAVTASAASAEECASSANALDTQVADLNNNLSYFKL
jgi:methyl-accepting chemotaxis protein